MICEKINLLILLPKLKEILQPSVEHAYTISLVGTEGCPPSSPPLPAAGNRQRDTTLKIREKDTGRGYLLQTLIAEAGPAGGTRVAGRTRGRHLAAPASSPDPFVLSHVVQGESGHGRDDLGRPERRFCNSTRNQKVITKL